jgi:hypothetical protein
LAGEARFFGGAEKWKRISPASAFRWWCAPFPITTSVPFADVGGPLIAALNPW